MVSSAQSFALAGTVLIMVAIYAAMTFIDEMRRNFRREEALDEIEFREHRLLDLARERARARISQADER